ncbi:MAG: methionine gamma-lyase family protein [Clostridiales Family XIII bacterium]|jgi:cystathionine beta-lyase family protein involved in aluminum resistance|nr:methionine gamma-lyase family protein [Clostridiales Family XIII bacterium]
MYREGMPGTQPLADEAILRLVDECENECASIFRSFDKVAEKGQYKVLSAMKKARLSDTHFSFTTGYGYDDAGRQATEKIFADVFGAESSLVRTQIVNGTHAIFTVFSGILRPGETLLYCTGEPYDSLFQGIGLTGDSRNSLASHGIGYKQTGLLENGGIDFPALEKALTPDVKMACIQRATGYSSRRALLIDEIAQWAAFVKSRSPDVVTMVDNCYGEFLEESEPTEVGVDIVAGSLIKNPGGGLALSGGYIAGKSQLVGLAAERLTCPGIGGECGLTFGQTRNILQGLFLAPGAVRNAVRGAVLAAAVMGRLGFDVKPLPGDPRSDIVQTITLGSKEGLIAFCEGIQAASPVDAFASPIPAPMPGYEDEVVMAAGGFVTGSTLELSADGPVREPFNVYFQGGLTYEHAKTGVISAAERLRIKGFPG